MAKELLAIFSQQGALNNLCFFDNVSSDVPEKLFSQFPIVRSFDQVKKIFAETGDPSFCLGLGNPVLRYRLYTQFVDAGGTLTSVISPRADIGQFDNHLEAGCCILPGAVITASVTLGKGCLINPNVTISHDSVVGDFVEISPGVNVTGNCRIGDFSFLGSNSVLLPKISIGRNVIVGAGAVVTKDVPANSLVVGVPAVIRKRLEPLNI